MTHFLNVGPNYIYGIGEARYLRSLLLFETAAVIRVHDSALAD